MTYATLGEIVQSRAFFSLKDPFPNRCGADAFFLDSKGYSLDHRYISLLLNTASTFTYHIDLIPSPGLLTTKPRDARRNEQKKEQKNI